MGASGAVLEAVRGSYSGSRELLETVFKDAGIDSDAARAETILEAMGVGVHGEVYYSGDTEEPCTDAERYEALIGTFFSGVWLPGAV